MIIGITGTDGAGKGAVVQTLVKKHGYTHFSSRQQIEIEVQKRGLEANRANLRIVANDLRRQYGNAVLVERALADIAEQGIENAVIESIRASAEVDALKAAGGTLWAVDADAKQRYRRITGRGSASDKVSFAEFCKHEELEMNDPDPHGMQKAAVIKAADVTIYNNHSLGALKKAVAAQL